MNTEKKLTSPNFGTGTVKMIHTVEYRRVILGNNDDEYFRNAKGAFINLRLANSFVHLFLNLSFVRNLFRSICSHGKEYTTNTFY